jgi:hypothetical protein
MLARVPASKKGSTPTPEETKYHAKDDVPGVNGMEYNSKDNHLYFTCTSQTIFGSVRVDAETFEAVGEPEEIAKRGMWADDFIIDEGQGVAYVTTHRQNTIEKVKLDGSTEQENAVGEPLNLELIGPTSGTWKRGSDGGQGKIAYFATDGGCKNPYEGVVREDHVLKVEFY